MRFASVVVAALALAVAACGDDKAEQLEPSKQQDVAVAIDAIAVYCANSGESQGIDAAQEYSGMVDAVNLLSEVVKDSPDARYSEEEGSVREAAAGAAEDLKKCDPEPAEKLRSAVEDAG